MGSPLYMMGRPGIQPPVKLGAVPRGMDAFAQSYNQASQPNNELLAKIYAAKKSAEPGMGELQKTAHYASGLDPNTRGNWENRFPQLKGLIKPSVDQLSPGTSSSMSSTGPTITTESVIDQDKTIAETGRIGIQNAVDQGKLKIALHAMRRNDMDSFNTIIKDDFTRWKQKSDVDLISQNPQMPPPPPLKLSDFADYYWNYVLDNGETMETSPENFRTPPPVVNQPSVAPTVNWFSPDYK